jgi:tyrosyl-tRNA synthetase
MKSEFLTILKDRGFIHQATDMEGLDAILAKETVTAYIGYDATADSLHVGNLVSIMMLYWLQQTGHCPIVLMGGGTTKVGDPSGKDTQRQLLDDDKIQSNIEGMKKAFSHFLTFGERAGEALLINNNDWLSGLNYIEFLRDFGRHFSVNRMLSFDSVKLRLDREQPLSFLEFNYMILQAYDFYELNQRYGCLLQMGGSDQWGNIVNGVDLTRRLVGKHVFGLTAPLITTSSGAKMGKSVTGAIWLNADRLKPYDYWQFWRNTEDADVGRYLRLFTTLPLLEIEKIEKLQGAEINDAKKILADKATAMAHGERCLSEIHATVATLFEKQSEGLSGLPTVEMDQNELSKGIPLLDLLCRAGLATSKSEARRLIQGNGVKINDVVVTEELMLVSDNHLTSENGIKMSVGKKKHAVLKVI